MNSGQRVVIMQRLLCTSVSDCEVDLKNYNDPTLLMDLLVECHMRNQLSREQAVRRRIAALIRAWK